MQRLGQVVSTDAAPILKYQFFMLAKLVLQNECCKLQENYLNIKAKFSHGTVFLSMSAFLPQLPEKNI